MTGDTIDPRRLLPGVDRVIADPRLANLGTPALRTAAARAAIESARDQIQSGKGTPGAAQIVKRAIDLLVALERPSLRRIINATGVILHTNLGRAPLSTAALAAMEAAGTGYTNLEFDLPSGGRGSRFSHLDSLLQRVTGAEAGIAVNNNASAMLLLLSAVCQGREVIISRSQAVEIGGGFRIPDVLRQSGAILVEVGTTNCTTVADFEAAITDRTAALLRVHASNFRIIGFTAFPEIEQLTELAHSRNVLMLDDLGSGCLIDTQQFGMLAEPTVQQSIAANVDVVAFSGDKLLGGPQAGILAGHRGQIDLLRRHPLARAVRMDKIGIAALSATLQHYARGDALEQIPVWKMIAAPMATIEPRAAAWAAVCPLPSALVRSRSMVGGGSLPEEGVETWTLALSTAAPDALAARLRARTPAIVARITNGRVLLDPRTVQPGEDSDVARALSELQPGHDS